MITETGNEANKDSKANKSVASRVSNILAAVRKAVNKGKKDSNLTDSEAKVPVSYHFKVEANKG